MIRCNVFGRGYANACDGKVIRETNNSSLDLSVIDHCVSMWHLFISTLLCSTQTVSACNVSHSNRRMRPNQIILDIYATAQSCQPNSSSAKYTERFSFAIFEWRRRPLFANRSLSLSPHFAAKNSNCNVAASNIDPNEQKMYAIHKHVAVIRNECRVPHWLVRCRSHAILCTCWGALQSDQARNIIVFGNLFMKYEMSVSIDHFVRIRNSKKNVSLRRKKAHSHSPCSVSSTPK